ncbi:hypothetical protein [Pseudaminobacter manganicus]
MTVGDATAASGSVLCHWFNREGETWTPQHAGYKREQLEMANLVSPSQA